MTLSYLTDLIRIYKNLFSDIDIELMIPEGIETTIEQEYLS
jgi:hypothetical protein